MFEVLDLYQYIVIEIQKGTNTNGELMSNII